MQFSLDRKRRMKVRNFEANERYRLCYRNKHLPCIFTFQQEEKLGPRDPHAAKSPR